MAEGSIGEQEIANRKYIGPNKTGDNIDADRVANYIWDGSAWIRQTAAAGGGATEYTDGDATTTHPVGGIPVFNKAGVITAVSDTNPLPTTATITGGGDASAANQTTEISKLTSIDTKIPASPSTSGKQDTGNTSLASIDGKITAVNTGAVVVSSSALPTGAATSAKQPALGTAGTPSADVITVQGKTSMTPLLTDASATTQPVSATSLPLPSGASTSAKQDTGNTSVASIDTKTPALGQALAAGSVPVVLPAAQITTLTPPAAITGFATSTKQSDGTQKTQVVDGSGNVIGATSNALDVNIKSGSSAGTQYADGAARGTSTGNLMMVDDGTNIQSAAGTTGGLLKVDLSGTAANSTAVKTDGSAVTQPVSGTVTANAGTGTMAVSNTNLDVALSTRLKPADTLTKVATVDTITNVVHIDDNAGSITVDATSLPLPTLAATSTKQSDGSQKSQIVDGSGNVIGATANALDVNLKSGGSSAVTTSGAITGTTSVTLTLSNTTTVAVQITGTYVATMVAERSVDGTNFTAVYGYANANETTYQKNSFTAADANAIWTFDVAGCTKFRIRCTAFTSGTATVNLVGVTSANQITESFAYIIGSLANLGVNANQAGNWTTRTADGSGNLINSTSNALDINIKSGNPTSITANAGTNLNTSALALDATLTGGTAKSVMRGGAKGTTTAADVTSTASGANHQPVDVAIYDASGNQITSFGGGTQYADGAARGTATGTLLMVDDGTNIQSAIGTTAGVLKVDLSATAGNATAVKTDSSATTQPVSGTFWQATQPVSLASVPSHAVTNAGTFAVQSAATLSAETTKVIGTVRTADGTGNLYTSNSTTFTAKNAQDTNLLGTLGTAFSTAGKVDVKGADGDVFVRQTTAANLNATVVGTGTFAVQADNTKIAGNAILAGNGASGTGAQRVTIASDSTGQVAPAANATATGTSIYNNTALSNTKQAVNASAGNLYGYHIYNPNTVVIYVQLWNVASGSVTVGTTAPTAVIAVPAGGWADAPPSGPPISFGTALTIAATTTSTGSTAPTSALLCNIWYK